MHVWFSTFIQMCNYAFVVKIPWLRHDHLNNLQVPEERVSVQSLSHVWLFVTPMDCSTPSFPVPHQLLELAQTHIHWADECHPTVSSSVIPFSWLQSFTASRSLLMSQFFASGGQYNGASASSSVLPMNIQDWFL